MKGQAKKSVPPWAEEQLWKPSEKGRLDWEHLAPQSLLVKNCVSYMKKNEWGIISTLEPSPTAQQEGSPQPLGEGFLNALPCSRNLGFDTLVVLAVVSGSGKKA